MSRPTDAEVRECLIRSQTLFEALAEPFPRTLRERWLRWRRMELRGLIEDEGPALDYEAAVEAILSLVGRRVEVTGMSRDPLASSPSSRAS